MNRRAFLLAATSAVAAISAQRLYGQPSEQILKNCVRKGVRIGAQATWDDLQDPSFAAFVVENFNTLTAGHELKWSSMLRPSPTTYNFARADAMVDFATRHGMYFHGHNLCWNHWLPSWAESTLTRANAAHYLREHIDTVVRRYAGRIDSWDVVNEPLGTWGNAKMGPSPRPWIDLIGPTYLDIAFHAAAAADPHALRVLNFADLENSGWGLSSRQQALTLLKGMLERHVPVQAIGLESHLDGSVPVENESQNRFIQAVRGMGLEILITELDIIDTAIVGGLTQRDDAVALAYSEYLQKVVPRTGATQVIFWTPWDGSDWLESVHGIRFDRADGNAHRPGLLDAGLHRKPAFYAVAHALQRTLG